MSESIDTKEVTPPVVISDEMPSSPVTAEDQLLPRVRGELEWISDRISTQSRVIAIGALAVVWAVLSGEADSFRPNLQHLFELSVAALGVLVIDFIQYLAGYWQQRVRLKAIQRQREPGRAVRSLFRIREMCFHVKCALVIVTSVLLIRTAVSTLSAKSDTASAVPRVSSPNSPERK